MTPKEKANYLLHKFIDEVIGLECEDYIEQAKQCALIAVDEILEALKIDLDKDLSTIDIANFTANKIIYWQEVKKEIEAL